jgi:hypothetical protein
MCRETRRRPPSAPPVVARKRRKRPAAAPRAGAAEGTPQRRAQFTLPPLSLLDAAKAERKIDDAS